MLAGIAVSTTRVNEFLSAMNKAHVPKKVVIPLAVMLRYLPTIREDWHFIKDAMRLRDVSPSLKGLISHPGMTIECLYSPLLMAASKAADELAIASVTRGIENPHTRTCLIQIRFRITGFLNHLLFCCNDGSELYWERGCNMIHFQDIQFRYEGTISSEIGVKDINLIVHTGECVLLCGRSAVEKQLLQS